MRLVILLSCILGLLSQSLFANALSVTNVSYDLAAKTVTFNIGWQNSWRTNREPNNWDAAWVFVKFRECGFVNDPWTHGIIDPTLASHTFPSNLEPTLSDGSAVGIDPAPNNRGVMLRRTANGVYPNVPATTVTLNVTNLPAVGTLLDVKVIGIEMVFVPQGQFFIGDNCSRYSFNRQLITGEGAVTLNTGISWPHWADASPMPATYPKGFDAFYMMKYEISQGQYTDFLNTISSNAQSNRYPGSHPDRYTLNNLGTPPNVYQATRPDRAMHSITWADLTAYLDWAALRPMSEMEYEKACRGPLPPVACEYAWGSTRISKALTISTTIPTENGTETIINAPVGGATIPPNCNFLNPNLGSVPFTGGDGGFGPLRVGIFATGTTSSREGTGATYYGIMEMSGNVWEFVVPAVTSTQSQNFRRTWGDGNLLSNGDPDVADWPSPASTAVARLGCQVGIRGGSWGNDWNETFHCISGREHIRTSGWVARTTSVGGRGVR